jgi:lambda family phage portal protein
MPENKEKIIKNNSKKTVPKGKKGTNFTNSGYSLAGASWEKKALKGFKAVSGSPQEDIDWNNTTLRQRARILTMASPVADSAIKANRTNVIGIGLRLKARVKARDLGITDEQADALNKEIEEEFALWAEDKCACDAIGMNDFYELQQTALRSWLTSGDVFGLIKQYKPTLMHPYSSRIMLIEADRVSTPSVRGSAVVGTNIVNMTSGINPDNGNRIHDGVEINSDGMVVAYHISNNYPFEYTFADTKWSRVLAYQEETGLPNIIHLMEAERPDQYRGVTYLASVIEPLLQVRRYTESELMAAIIESFFTAFVKTEAEPDEMPFDEVSDEDIANREENDYTMGPGEINIMKPGEDITFANPTRPAGGFSEFIKAICTQIGSSLEIPRELLLKEFTASYSASRAALLEAWKAFKMRREWFSNDFCKPIYEIWFSEAVARGRIHAPGFFTNPRMKRAYLNSEWHGPSQGQLDPVKEITAESLAIAEGFSTHEESTVRLNGGQWDSNMQEIKRENKIIFDVGQDMHKTIEKQTESNSGSNMKTGDSDTEEPENDEKTDDQKQKKELNAQIKRQVILDSMRGENNA